MRSDALAIMEAAYRAIDTEYVVRSKLSLSGTTLSIDGRAYDLASYKRVRLLGFGKASCKAVETVERIIRAHLTDGIAIDVRPGTCEIVDVTQGTHPMPSQINVDASSRVVDMAKDTSPEDLVIVVVSGGGSSLLCWPQGECDQGVKLYEDARRVGATIEEVNTIRRHISGVKGGGLAALFHPATIIGLIFCDVPGDRFQDVASGPTYLDESTVSDAKAIIDAYGFEGYTLQETPKDRSRFENVHNVGMVSNMAALAAMRDEAQKRGYAVHDAGAAHYDQLVELIEAMELVETMVKQLGSATAVIVGGEVRLKVTRKGGTGGRCLYMGLEALRRIGQGDVFVAFASDGRDNCDAAGAIVDQDTLRKGRETLVQIEARLDSFDAYGYFQNSGDLIFTGPTDSNVSDLYFVLRKRP